jgi:hypothetical protein
MRTIQELVVMRRTLETEYNRLVGDTNKGLTNNYDNRKDALTRMVAILDDAVDYYPLFEFLSGEGKPNTSRIINHFPADGVK